MTTNAELLIKHVNIVQKDGILAGSGLLVNHGMITFVGPVTAEMERTALQVVDGGGMYLSPGLIDSHTHGGVGLDFITANPDEIKQLLYWYASNGVTRVLPTLSAGLKPEFLASCEKLEAFRRNEPFGEHIGGIHIEGPYINPGRKGAQPYDENNPVSPDQVDDYLGYFKDAVRVMTLAPEIEGGMDLLASLAQKGIICSIGHSKATYEETLQAIGLGLQRTTHTFNGMDPFHHRQPGIVGAAMVSDAVYSEITLDGFHVHPGAAKALIRAKGYEKVVLITDSMQAAGLGDGEFVRPGNRKIFVKDGIARLETGSIAGSVLTLNKAVANAVDLLDIPLNMAVAMASENVADSLGLTQAGWIAEGCEADLIIHNAHMEVFYTFKQGKQVYSRE